MSLWLLIVLLGMIKLPIAALMLWMPFREDEAMRAPAASEPSDEDGGSPTPPQGPPKPRPRWPVSDPPGSCSPARRRGLRVQAEGRRRGSHTTPSPPSPRRVPRTGAPGGGAS